MPSSFAFLRLLISLSGHRWQCKQSLPFEQLFGFQYHAHGRHSLVACLAEPTDGIPAAGTGAGNPGGGDKPGGGAQTPNGDTRAADAGGTMRTGLLFLQGAVVFAE